MRRAVPEEGTRRRSWLGGPCHEGRLTRALDIETGVSAGVEATTTQAIGVRTPVCATRAGLATAWS
jgi:hypothetical protein